MSTGAPRSGVVFDERYRLVNRLGGGGAAAVWRAEDLDEQRPVALKLLHPRFRVDNQARERLRREARILLEFDHPNLARAYSVRLDHQEPYLVLELINGETLESEIADRAEDDRHFSPDEILQLSGQLVAGVSYAHARSVVHRDLKPSNVMLLGDQVRILDFGLAKILEDAAETTAVTTRGRILGSSFYMAPEQAAGGEVDVRADVFSLGVLFFEMLTLRRAWVRNAEGGPVRAFAEPARANAHNSPGAILDRICRGPRPRPTLFRPSLPPAVDVAVRRAMATDPDDRQDTVVELHTGLVRAFLGGAKTRRGQDFDRAEARTLASEPPDYADEEAPTALADASEIPSAPSGSSESDAADFRPGLDTEFDGVPFAVLVHTLNAKASKAWAPAGQSQGATLPVPTSVPGSVPASVSGSVPASVSGSVPASVSGSVPASVASSKRAPPPLSSSARRRSSRTLPRVWLKLPPRLPLRYWLIAAVLIGGGLGVWVADQWREPARVVNPPSPRGGQPTSRP